MDKPQRQRRWEVVVAVTGLILLFAFLNSGTVTLVDDFPSSPIFIGFCIGISIGQLNLIAVWAALAPGRRLVTVPWSAFLTTVMWLSYVVSLDRIGGQPFVLGTVLLASQVAMQIPLWLAAWCWGYQLRPVSRLDESTRQRSFNIGDLLIGTSLLAVALGLARFLVLHESWDIRDFRIGREMLVILPAVAMVNLLVVVPCVWAAFQPPARVAGFATAWLAVVTVVTVCQFWILCTLLGSPGPDWIEVLLTFWAMNLSQCVTVAVVLVLFRLLGYRLIRL